MEGDSGGAGNQLGHAEMFLEDLENLVSSVLLRPIEVGFLESDAIDVVIG